MWFVGELKTLWDMWLNHQVSCMGHYLTSLLFSKALITAHVSPDKSSSDSWLAFHY